MNRTINTLYWLGDVVYLRVNDECKPGMVTGIRLAGNGSLTYAVTWRGGADTLHYECELTNEYVPDYGVHEAQAEANP